MAIIRDTQWQTGAERVISRFQRFLELATAIAEPEALRSLSSRDILLLLAAAWRITAKHAAPSILRSAVNRDERLRRTWIAYVHAVDAMSIEAWREHVGDPESDGPQTRELEALADDLGAAERMGVELFAQQYRVQVTAGMARAASDGSVTPASNGAFPRFAEILQVLLATLDEPPEEFAVRCADLLGGAKSVAGCRVLYVGILLRTTISLQRLVDVTTDGMLTPSLEPAGRDRHLWQLQQQINDVQLLSEEQGEVLQLVCGPATPRLLKELRNEISTVRDAVAECVVVLARSYRVGKEAVFRLRFELIKSNVDDAGRYVEESGLPFEPEIGQLTLRASGVLPLFVRPLYGHRPEVGVRELLQNALDAVWARRAIERAEGQTGPDSPEYVLVALTDRTGPATPLLRNTVAPPAEWHHWIEVRDSGVGMTPDVVRDHFLTVGGSFDPAEDLTKRASLGRPRRQRIGRFGVGVCAAFLLGTEVQVVTRHLTALEDRAVCLRFVERDDTTEIYRCTAPVGTTVRVRLSQDTYQRLTGNPHVWDWFARSDPKVSRVTVHNGEVYTIEPALRQLIGNNEVRELSVPPYGTVRWTPSPECFKSHIFVNGVRIVSLHRNFDRNILDPVGQLKQPVIDIDDATGATDLLLTRDNFASYPEPIFAAIRRDAVTDHLAWTINVAQSGRDRSLPWASRLWEEEHYSRGQGDGVISAIPFVVTHAGLVPLDSGLLAQAGITEANFLLACGNVIAHGEAQTSSRTPPACTANDLLAWIQPVPGEAVGVMHVNMFGGFGYDTLAAGIGQTFTYGTQLHATTQVQLVTPLRGDPYDKMHERDVVARWADSVLFRGAEAATFIYKSKHDLAEKKRGLEAVRHRNDDRIQTFLAKLDKPGSDSAGETIRRVVAGGFYGVLHLWFGESAEDATPPERSELADAWRRYRLPPVLPFTVSTSPPATPLAADLQMRTERVRREETTREKSELDPNGTVAGGNISTPQWRPPSDSV